MLTAKFCVYHFDLFNVTWALVKEPKGKYHVTIGKPETKYKTVLLEDGEEHQEPYQVNTIVATFHTDMTPSESTALKFIGAL